MSGLAYFFKPKITTGDSSSSSTEKRPGRRSKASKSAETAEKSAAPPPVPTEETIPETVPEPTGASEPEPAAEPEPTPVPEPEPESAPETKSETAVVSAEEPQPESQPNTEVKPVVITMEEQTTENVPSPTPTPKIKLKFNLRSQSVQDTSDDRVIPSISNNQLSQLSENEDEESSDGETRLKIDDHDGNMDEAEIPMPEPIQMTIVSPTKKKSSSSSASSRKKVISHLIGTSSNTLTLDEPSPIKLVPHEAHFSEVKQTKSGRTIKYTPYFKELVQGASISPPSSPSHSTTPAKRPSNYSKKKQSSIKADLDAIKNASLSISIPLKGKKSAGGSPKAKKQPTSPVKRLGQGKKSATPKAATTNSAKSKRVVIEAPAEEMESDEDNDAAQARSDDEEFRQDEQSDEDEDDELDAEEDDDDQSAGGGMASDEEEWTSNGTKFDSDRSLNLTSTLGSISSEMLDGYSLWAMKYRARHRSMSLDDKQLYRTWKKMSAHDRQRWCLKAEKENFHYPIAAALLKGTTNSTTNEPSTTSTSTTKPTKTPKRKKGTDDHPPILLQKTLNQYSKTQPSFSSALSRTSMPPVKQAPTTPTVNAPPKNYDVLDIAAGIYLLGDSLTKMGEKVRQLGHLNPRGASAATSIDSLTAILFDGTLCACNLMACLGNEITSMNPTANRSDPLTNKLMENLGILLPGLN